MQSEVTLLLGFVFETEGKSSENVGKQ